MKKLRLIQCGVGGFGAMWAKNYSGKSPEFDLVAIVDPVEKANEEIGTLLELPRNRRFASLDDAIKKVKADAVLTVTPPAVHVQHAKLAFAGGMHLMAEKPISDTLESARTMVKLAAKAQKQLVISQNYRYRAANQRLRKLIAEKAAGDLGHGHLDFYIPADFTGTFREKMQYPLLIDMAIHHLDLIRCITGRNILKVTALSFRPGWSWYVHEPALKMLLELDGGIAFSYSGDWTARGKATGWNGSWRLQCADGSIHMEEDKITLVRSERWNRNVSIHPVETGALERTDQAATLHAFAESIRTGKPAETSGADNLHSFGAVCAGVISARDRATVNVPKLIGAAK